MVSLGVGRGGSVAQAFQEGEQQALQGRLSRQQMQTAAAEEARRSQAFQDTQADRSRVAGAFAGLGGFGVPPTTGGGFDVGGMFAGATPAAGPQTGRPNLTFGLLRESEGFRATPYWDVNAFRGGFGSDTVTLADGRVLSVQPGMQISREDAERDLERRVTQEFAPRAAQQVGPEIWSSLPEHVTAPLISVTYNYGSLPRSVVAAVQTGDPETIAQAVEALAGHNDGVNRRRRMQEAAIIRSGGQIDPGLMRAAAAPTGEPGLSTVTQAPDRMFMGPETMQTRAGLAEPFMLGRETPAPVTPPAPVDRMAEFSEDFMGTYNADQGAYDFRTNPLLRGVFGEAALQAIPTRPQAAPAAPVVPETPPAGLQVPAEMQPTEDTIRPTPRPVPTIEEFDAQFPGPEPDAAPPPAGLRTTTPLVQDIQQGTTPQSASPSMPGMTALFTDLPAVQQERAALQATLALLDQQMAFARQMQDSNLAMTVMGQATLAQIRMRTLDQIQAGAIASTGNFDPMAQALSQMAGQTVQIVPREGNTVDVVVDGQVVQQGLPVSQMISAYRQGVDEQYRARLSAAAAEEASRDRAIFDMRVEALKDQLAQEAQGTREQANAAFDRVLEQQFPRSEFFTEKITDSMGQELVVIYDRKNMDTPVRSLQLRENPALPGQFTLVERDITSLR
jgi:GH24 family phage-related lysozyme (muramidase)